MLCDNTEYGKEKVAPLAVNNVFRYAKDFRWNDCVRRLRGGREGGERGLYK
jgi:hypothetical protein